jgi:hypothetical protein
VRLHPARSLSAPLQVQLTEYVMDMRLDRGETDVEVAGNLFIAEPLPISRTISSSRGDNTGVAFLSCIVPRAAEATPCNSPAATIGEQVCRPARTSASNAWNSAIAAVLGMYPATPASAQTSTDSTHSLTAKTTTCKPRINGRSRRTAHVRTQGAGHAQGLIEIGAAAEDVFRPPRPRTSPMLSRTKRISEATTRRLRFVAA